MVASPWSWLKRFTGRTLEFPVDDGGCLAVREDAILPYFEGACTRARCLSDDSQQYALLRLELSAGASQGGQGGLITLDELTSLEREVTLMAEAGHHPNITACYGFLVENAGGVHTRFLLCDPGSDSLAGRAASGAGALSVATLAEVGQDLTLGLAHLHDRQILCGNVDPANIIYGCDYYWKLGRLNCSARLPISSRQWLEDRKVQWRGNRPPNLPSELSTEDDRALRPSVDIWLLGYSLACLLVAMFPGSTVLKQRQGDSLVMLDVGAFLQTEVAHLWLLLHWMLAAEPSQRPTATEAHVVLKSLAEASPSDLLQIMPASARFHCNSTALGAVRKLATDELSSSVSDATQRRSIAHSLVGASLEKLRSMLADPAKLDLLCQNCGVGLDWQPQLASDGSGVCEKDTSSKVDGDSESDDGCPPQLVASTAIGSGANSTDEGSASDGDSSVDSDAVSMHKNTPLSSFEDKDKRSRSLSQTRLSQFMRAEQEGYSTREYKKDM